MGKPRQKYTRVKHGSILVGDNSWQLMSQLQGDYTSNSLE